jgi:tetratricopeptide (TPR) repeat protein
MLRVLAARDQLADALGQNPGAVATVLETVAALDDSLRRRVGDSRYAAELARARASLHPGGAAWWWGQSYEPLGSVQTLCTVLSLASSLVVAVLIAAAYFGPDQLPQLIAVAALLIGLTSYEPLGVSIEQTGGALAHAIRGRLGRSDSFERGLKVTAALLLVLAGLAVYQLGLPKLSEWSRVRGNQAFAAGQWLDAAASYERASRLDPTNARARSELADVFWALGREDEAERSYRAAIGQQPTLHAASSNLAHLYLSSGDASGPRRAIALLEPMRPLFEQAAAPPAERRLQYSIAKNLAWAYLETADLLPEERLPKAIELGDRALQLAGFQRAPRIEPAAALGASAAFCDKLNVASAQGRWSPEAYRKAAQADPATLDLATTARVLARRSRPNPPQSKGNQPAPRFGAEADCILARAFEEWRCRSRESDAADAERMLEHWAFCALYVEGESEMRLAFRPELKPEWLMSARIRKQVGAR